MVLARRRSIERHAALPRRPTRASARRPGPRRTRVLRLPRFRLVEPTTWTEAATLLREHGAAESDVARGTPSVPVMLVAGGTDLFPNMKRRQFTPQVLISVGRVKGAREISNGSGLRISAGATLTEIASHPTVTRKYAALAQAAGAVSTPQLRNMGTIGGNLCLDTRCNWYDQSLFWRTAEGYCMKTHPEVVCRVAPSSPRCLAVASADTVPALLALGASVRIEEIGRASCRGSVWAAARSGSREHSR